MNKDMAIYEYPKLVRVSNVVSTSMPDGAYLREVDDKIIQVVVIGPMLYAPGDYEVAVREYYNDYKLHKVEFLEGPDKEVIMRRGFFSMHFFCKETQ